MRKKQKKTKQYRRAKEASPHWSVQRRKNYEDTRTWGKQNKGKKKFIII